MRNTKTEAALSKDTISPMSAWANLLAIIHAEAATGHSWRDQNAKGTMQEEVGDAVYSEERRVGSLFESEDRTVVFTGLQDVHIARRGLRGESATKGETVEVDDGQATPASESLSPASGSEHDRHGRVTLGSAVRCRRILESISVVEDCAASRRDEQLGHSVFLAQDHGSGCTGSASTMLVDSLCVNPSFPGAGVAADCLGERRLG